MATMLLTFQYIIAAFASILRWRKLSDSSLSVIPVNIAILLCTIQCTCMGMTSVL